MVVVGTSRAFGGIIPSKMTKFTVNIANDSQSIYYDIELLKKYFEQLPNLNTIVFDINIFTFKYNLDNGPEPWRALYFKNTFNIAPQSKELSLFDNFLVKMYKPRDIIFHISSIPLYQRYYKSNGFALSSDEDKEIDNENASKMYKHLTSKYMHSNEKVNIIKGFGKIFRKYKKN